MKKMLAFLSFIFISINVVSALDCQYTEIINHTEFVNNLYSSGTKMINATSWIKSEHSDTFGDYYTVYNNMVFPINLSFHISWNGGPSVRDVEIGARSFERLNYNCPNWRDCTDAQTVEITYNYNNYSYPRWENETYYLIACKQCPPGSGFNCTNDGIAADSDIRCGSGRRNVAGICISNSSSLYVLDDRSCNSNYGENCENSKSDCTCPDNHICRAGSCELDKMFFVNIALAILSSSAILAFFYLEKRKKMANDLKTKLSELNESKKKLRELNKKIADEKKEYEEKKKVDEKMMSAKKAEFENEIKTRQAELERDRKKIHELKSSSSKEISEKRIEMEKAIEIKRIELNEYKKSRELEIERKFDEDKKRKLASIQKKRHDAEELENRIKQDKQNIIDSLIPMEISIRLPIGEEKITVFKNPYKDYRYCLPPYGGKTLLKDCTEEELKKTKLLHHHIWEKWGHKYHSGYEIHHKDGNKWNNDINNLEEITRKEHDLKHGRGVK